MGVYRIYTLSTERFQSFSDKFDSGLTFSKILSHKYFDVGNDFIFDGFSIGSIMQWTPNKFI